MKTQYVDVVDEIGERRVAGIQAGRWVTISAGICSLAGRENSLKPVGEQCAGWPGVKGQPLLAADGRTVYQPVIV
jgi:hypothetical protein